MVTFTAKTDKELAEEKLWSDGEYGFKILEAKDATSRKGNEMIALKIELYDGERKTIINDYLGVWDEIKLKDCAYCVSIPEEYEKGTIKAWQLESKIGRAIVKIEQNKDQQYPAKNVIAKYIRPEKWNETTQSGNQTSPLPHLDDDIPF